MSAETQPTVCFVLMRMRDPLVELHEHVIKVTVEGIGPQHSRWVSIAPEPWRSIHCGRLAVASVTWRLKRFSVDCKIKKYC
jgi:hypothetical protein